VSIYATLWNLQFPRTGEYYLGCDWIEVCGQGVPGHIGTPTAGFGYESGDPYADFLPPAITLEDEDDDRMRAVVIVTGETKKGTERSGQEYVEPLLVFTGEEYARMSFDEVYDRVCVTLARRAEIECCHAPGSSPAKPDSSRGVRGLSRRRDGGRRV